MLSNAPQLNRWKQVHVCCTISGTAVVYWLGGRTCFKVNGNRERLGGREWYVPSQYDVCMDPTWEAMPDLYFVLHRYSVLRQKQQM